MQPQLITQEEVCGICNEAVTNPICPQCLERQMKAWVNAKKPCMTEIVEGTADVVQGFEEGHGNCILCNGRINACAHCVVKVVYHALKSNDEELAEAFRQAFNYDLDPAEEDVYYL